MKTLLTIEQSANLISKGIDAYKASAIIANDDSVSQWTDRGKPIFTLYDLLSIIPQADRDLGGIMIDFDVERGKWASTYEFFDYIAYEDELIDSLYKLILYLFDNSDVNLIKQ